MKRLFILFLIAVLPLRGWAGDVMGVRMAHQQLATANQVADLAAMPSDCPMHAQSDQGAGSGNEHAGIMKNCASCDLCLPLAALTRARLEVSEFAGGTKPLIGVDDFVSAALAPTEKPPIF